MLVQILKILVSSYVAGAIAIMILLTWGNLTFVLKDERWRYWTNFERLYYFDFVISTYINKNVNRSF